MSLPTLPRAYVFRLSYQIFVLPLYEIFREYFANQMSITSEPSSIDRGKISYRRGTIASARNFGLAETKEIVKMII